MSKTVKRKITVELPKPRDLSKNRLSVFQRLGTKKLKSLETAININTKSKDSKVIPTTPTTTTAILTSSESKADNVELEDVDPDLLEKKRAELQKELEIQLKMDSSRKAVAKEIVRKRKKAARSSSSSSSSSSDTGSSSDSSSSSSSKESKRKIRKAKLRKRGSSSSSDEPRKKVVKVKRVCHKKIDGSKVHKSSHSKKSVEGKLRKRSPSPTLRKRVTIGSSPPKSVQKIPTKTKLSVDNVAKHHRMKEAAREKEREREFQLRDRDREKEKDRERMRSRERARSRSPKMRPKSRTPKRLSRSRELKHKSPASRRIGSPPKSRSGGSMRRDRSIDRTTKKDFKRHDSRERERERREKERLCREDAREAAREKERQEILARCQERHERERLAREKLRRERDDDRMKPDRLLPRPAERAMAIAAARDRSRDKSIDRDRLRSHSHSRSGRDRMDREKDPNPYDRVYEREDSRYDTHDRRIEKDDRVMRDDRDYIVRRHDDSRPDSMSSPYLTRDKRIVDRDDLDWDAGHGVAVGDQRYDDHIRDDRRMPRNYIEDRHMSERERDWMRESDLGRSDIDRGIYDRSVDRHVVRDWDRAEPNHALQARDNYADNRDWSGGINERQWDNKGKWHQQPPEEDDNWDEDEGKNWQDYNRIIENNHHDGGITAGMGSGLGNMAMNDVPRGGQNRRWNSWRGRRGSQHHSGDFRRQQDGIFQHDRSSMVYRRPPDAAPAETIIAQTVAADGILHPGTVILPQQSVATKSDVSAVGVIVSRQIVVPEIKVDDKKDEFTDSISAIPDEQLLEEVIPDDLSEFSDEADEILNRQEEVEKQNSQINGTPSIQTIPEETTAADQSKDAESLLLDKQVTLLETKSDINESKDMSEEMDLDFEEISDGELEEEARIRGLGDALGVDWASLVEESKAIAREKSLSMYTSAKQRWQPYSILLDVGISHKWAGKEFALKTLKDTKEKLMAEEERTKSLSQTEQSAFKVKEEKFDAEYGDAEETVEKSSELKKEDDLEIINDHPVACVQVAYRKNLEMRRNLIFNATGPYSRALSARRDLEMRRILCGLPKREIGCCGIVHKTDPGYAAIALSLFQKAVGDVN